MAYVDPEVFRPEIIDKVKHKLPKVEEFSTEPLEDYFNRILLDEAWLSIREALHIDLTDYVLLDMKYRWENSGDAAVNINGRPNKGKSNVLLWYYLNWSRLTGEPFRLSNIVFNSAEFNLLLKGIRVVDEPKFRLDEFSLEPGIALNLDEASDIAISGPLSMTIILQTTDIENRMRALQIGRFCAGVREILHGAYYNVYCIERDSKAKVVYGIVKMHETTDPSSDLVNLGFVRIPYVDNKVFNLYNAPKKNSIRSYGRGSQVNRISQIIQFFSEKLRADREYQKLPVSPSVERINYIQKNPLFTIFTTKDYFEDLEKMSRNPVMHHELMPYCRCSPKLHRSVMELKEAEERIREGSPKVIPEKIL